MPDYRLGKINIYRIVCVEDASEGTCQTLIRRLFEGYVLFIKCFVCGIFRSITKQFGCVI